LLRKELLQSAKLNPDETDFTKLRHAYAMSAEYRPYFPTTEEDIDDLESLIDAHKAKHFQKAITLADRLLRLNYLDIDAHIIASEAYINTGDKRKAVYHFKFATHILASVYQSGDGMSYQTAFKVVNLREEYVILQFFKLTRISQQMDYDQGHNFDVFETVDPKSNEPRRMYFNTDLIWEYRHNGLTSQTT
jgi:hypothetical protein